MTGYVKVFRQLLQNPVWTQLSPAVLKVSIYFLLKANYHPGKWYDGERQVEIPVGSFVTSYASTAKATHLSVKQVRGAMNHLENLSFAAYTRAQRWTLVSITNYARYQANEKFEVTVEGSDGAGSGHDKGTSGAGNGQQEKEGKKGRREETSSSQRRVALTPNEIVSKVQSDFPQLDVGVQFQLCSAYNHARGKHATERKLVSWCIKALQDAPLLSTNGITTQPTVVHPSRIVR